MVASKNHLPADGSQTRILSTPVLAPLFGRKADQRFTSTGCDCSFRLLARLGSYKHPRGGNDKIRAPVDETHSEALDRSGDSIHSPGMYALLHVSWSVSVLCVENV